MSTTSTVGAALMVRSTGEGTEPLGLLLGSRMQVLVEEVTLLSDLRIRSGSDIIARRNAVRLRPGSFGIQETEMFWYSERSCSFIFLYRYKK